MQILFGSFYLYKLLKVMFNTKTRLSLFACLNDATGAALKAAPAPQHRYFLKKKCLAEKNFGWFLR